MSFPTDQVDGYLFKASSSDPDTLNFDDVLRDPLLNDWIVAAMKEITELEKKKCWDEVPIEESKGTVLPGIWVFRRKRTPDGQVKKLKARYCVRGDLQDGDPETFAPVVAFSTVRIFLAFSAILDWVTISIDFVNAFVQAPLSAPIWIHLPRGFRSKLKGKTCLRLKRSLYGLAEAPKNWNQHLFKALFQLGFKPGIVDSCLLLRSDMIIVMYVQLYGN